MNTYTPDGTKIVHPAEVDFITRKQISEPVHIVQYDNRLPVLAVVMYKSGQVYTVPTTATAHIRLEKSDGTFVYNPALGVSNDKSTVYFEITQQMSVAHGLATAIVEIDIPGQMGGSSSMDIVVDRNPVQNGAIESTTEFKSIQQYVIDASNSAQAAKDSETNAKASETSASNSAQAAKDSETNAKASETSASNSAQAAKDSETNAKDSEIAAAGSAGQAEAIYQEFANFDVNRLENSLVNGHAVHQGLMDSSGDFILDSDGEVIEGRTIFADAGELIALHQMMDELRIVIERLHNHALLDGSY